MDGTNWQVGHKGDRRRFFETEKENRNTVRDVDPRVSAGEWIRWIVVDRCRWIAGCSVKLGASRARPLQNRLDRRLIAARSSLDHRSSSGRQMPSRAEHTSVAFVSVSAADRAPRGSPRRRRSLSLSVIKLSIRDI